MPTKKDRTPILPGKVYHIFNRGHNYNQVFLCQDDYLFFIDKLKEYMLATTLVYAYTLLPNHYHFLLRIHESSKLGEFSNQFRKFILSYTNMINFRENRSGSLFLHPFKRIEITSRDYFKRLIFYIHYNTEKHKISKNFHLYPYSSYKDYTSKEASFLEKHETYKIFGSKEDFFHYHKYVSDEKKIRNLILED